jgi:hypothetical protein
MGGGIVMGAGQSRRTIASMTTMVSLGRYALALGLATGLMWGSALPAAAAVPDPTGNAEMMARLRRGEVISRINQKGAVRSVEVMGMLNHPAATAFRVFTDYPRRPYIYPTTKKVEVRKPDPRKPQVYFLMGFPWPVGDRWVVDSEHLDPDNQHMTWQMLEGNVNTYAGEAQFYPVGNNKCVLSFSAMSDPNISVIPDWLMAHAQRLLLPAVVRSLRGYMDAGKHVTAAR